MNALILVDLQNDFCPGGALPVPQGDEVVAVANRLQPLFALVVATQDWHPADHSSFAVNYSGKQPGDTIELHGLTQVLWPSHCVQGTFGAQLRSDLDVSRIDQVFQKGVDSAIDSYSGFFDNEHRQSTGLADYLKDRGVKDVFIGGLATDYCVKFTALDALELGFRAHVIEDACRGVELVTGDVRRAVDEMRTSGADILHTSLMSLHPFRGESK